ncbi:uncharacterized protein LOC131225880 [Magnolia sinica]|uniref:uncharacterized protein LOC131225880 n=1 Tax=Magnolia sinica TaxID=86752 RepID=UPI0026589692|nr:uncharacterized protein LOC131225880 [Magnolia sinica]
MGVASDTGMEKGEETVVVVTDETEERKEEDGGEEEKKKEAGEESSEKEVKISRLQASNPVPPIQIQTPSPAQTRTLFSEPPLQTPQQQPSLASLNSTEYTNRISLFLFLFHMTIAITAVCFLIFKAIQGLLRNGSTQTKEKEVLEFWLPQIEGSAIISIILAWAWQKAFREWPEIMVRIILWSSFVFSLSAGILLLCFSMAPTDGVGVALIAFAVGNGLYACWVTQRIHFTAKVISVSLKPVAKFSDLNQPTFWMLGVGFMWMSLWNFAVIGALNFYVPPLIIIGLLLSLAWVTEVMRNVVNLTVCRVVSLYYLRGMQAETQFCFQRAMSQNLGSACLGSLFVPAIEALRIVARVLNLLKGEDEFMFSCAHCCLKVMEAIFRYGNGWAFVHIAAYGRGFVTASQSTWALFERTRMEPLVDADITSSICFLTGTASGSICVIFAAAWTYSEHKSYTATVSMLAFFIGYLMTRIGMALPHSCVSCYYVCYAENAGNRRLFDDTIPRQLDAIQSSRDGGMPTPRLPRRFTT